MKKEKQKIKTKNKKKKWKHFLFFFENYRRRVLRPRPFGTNVGLYIIARNKRDCFLAFRREVHLEKTRLVFLFNTE